MKSLCNPLFLLILILLTLIHSALACNGDKTYAEGEMGDSSTEAQTVTYDSDTSTSDTSIEDTAPKVLSFDDHYHTPWDCNGPVDQLWDLRELIRDSLTNILRNAYDIAWEQVDETCIEDCPLTSDISACRAADCTTAEGISFLYKFTRTDTPGPQPWQTEYTGSEHLEVTLPEGADTWTKFTYTRTFYDRSYESYDEAHRSDETASWQGMIRSDIPPDTSATYTTARASTYSPDVSFMPVAGSRLSEMWEQENCSYERHLHGIEEIDHYTEYRTGDHRILRATNLEPFRSELSLVLDMPDRNSRDERQLQYIDDICICTMLSPNLVCTNPCPAEAPSWSDVLNANYM